jgi:MoaA/NifB/PqqE/SkfB family radical SAM enzyme
MTPLGDLNRDSFSSIWNGRRYRSLRRKMLRDPGLMYLCHDCPFAMEQNVPARDAGTFEDRAAEFPKRIHIEPTVRCNLQCPACGRGMAARARRQQDLPFDLFERVITEAGPHLTHLNLYDYGESFLHPRIFDMIRLAKQVNPELTVIVSTNGVPLNTAQKRAELISSGCDEVIFSVDGASPETYSQYRVGGDFDMVIANMRALVNEKRASRSDVPRVVWRYILFKWNDSDDEMDRARALAKDIGVDWFCWMTTSTPPDGYSQRFVPGTAEYESIRAEMFPSIESICANVTDELK